MTTTHSNGADAVTALQVMDDQAGQALERKHGGTYELGTMSQEDFDARLTALKTMRARIASIHRGLMLVDVDYGVIPGTGDKATLYKSGADKLCQFYGYVPSFEESVTHGDGRSAPHISVVVRCRLHQGSDKGPVVGAGIGACNSWERKYRWKRGARKCPKCGQSTIIAGKEKFGGGWLCWKNKGGCGSKWQKGAQEIESQPVGDMENADPYDLLNTIIKMACKRAYVDATLRTTATGELYTQDIEDIEDMEHDAPPPPAVQRMAQAPAQRQEPQRQATVAPPAVVDAVVEPANDGVASDLARLQATTTPQDRMAVMKELVAKYPANTPDRARVNELYAQMQKQR